MKNYLLERGIVGAASLLPNQDPSPGSGRLSSKTEGKPPANLKSSLASWCAPIIVLMVVVMLCFAVAAVLLGEK